MNINKCPWFHITYGNTSFEKVSMRSFKILMSAIDDCSYQLTAAVNEIHQQILRRILNKSNA